MALVGVLWIRGTGSFAPTDRDPSTVVSSNLTDERGVAVTGIQRHSARNVLDPRPESQNAYSPGFSLPKGVSPRGVLAPDVKLEITQNFASARDDLMMQAERMCAGPEVTTIEEVKRQYATILASNQRDIAIQQLQRDEYLAFPSDGTVDRVVPPANFLAMRLYNAGEIGGVRCDVLFSLRMDDPRIAETVAACRSIREAVTDEEVERFNALSYHERRTRIEDHYTAIEAIGRSRAERLSAPELSARIRELSRHLLSGKFTINRTLYTVMKNAK